MPKSMDDAVVKKLFFELMQVQAVEAVKVQQGVSPAEKYYIRTETQEYLLKITPENINLQNYELLLQMKKAGLSVVSAVAWKFSSELKQLVLVFEWIPGKNLDQIILQSSEAEKIAYGKKAAELLLSFHQFPLGDIRKAVTPYKYFNIYRFSLFRHRAIYPHIREINQYVTSKKKIWKHCKRISFTHRDFRPENILVYRDKLYLIDFETADVGDPYEDFVFCISMQPDEYLSYSKALIEQYFRQNIPSEFWEWTCFYGVMAVQKYAIWKFKFKKQMVKYQAEHLFSLYSGMQSSIPVFWRSDADDNQSDSE